MKVLVFLSCLVLFQGSTGQNVWEPRYLGKAHLRHAAFVQVYKSENASLSEVDRWTLYISTFDSLTLGATDQVYYLRSPGSLLDTVDTWNNGDIKLLDNSAYWPNSPEYMPSEAVGVEGIVQTSGFLVPTKKDGQLQMYNTQVEPPLGPVNIAEGDSNEWSYHKVHWQDMNLDGLLDCVTARFHLPNIGSTKTEFVWFENPGTGMVAGWTEHVISTTGPDVHFDHVTQTVEGRGTYDCFVFGEFFSERVTIYWTEDPNNDWSDLSQVNSRVINGEAGQAFEVIVADLNRDNVKEIVATEYDTVLGIGHVKVYFFPADFRTDDFTSVIIADDFVPNGASGGQYMTPGTLLPFYPSVEYENEITADGLGHKPWVLLSGDDDGRMYILYPQSDVRDEWLYDKNLLVDSLQDTMGSEAVGDVDGDGFNEIFFAAYSEGRIYVYTYAP